MSKKQTLAALCLVILTTSVFAFEKPTYLVKHIFGFDAQAQAIEKQKQDKSLPKTKQTRITQDRKPQAQKIEAPEQVLYDQLFRLVVKFKKKAEEQIARRDQVTPLRDYFQKEAQLGDEQTRVLQDVATKYVEEVSIIDAHAKVIIENIRTRVPRNQPLMDKTILQPPAELKELQQKREELALRYRDHLRDLLGPEQFQNFEKFVQEKMTSIITVSPVESLRPAEETNSPFQPRTERRIEK
jgi:hypothetical protein